MFNNRNKFIKFFSSRTFTFIVAVMIILIGLAFYNDYQRQKDINDELSQLQEEVEQLQGKKVELSRLVEILESSNYIEKEARLRLGLKMSGEKVISVPQNARPEGIILGEATELTPPPPVYRQWLDYFFIASIE